MWTFDTVPVEGARQPERAVDSVGYDAFARVGCVIQPFRSVKIPLGFCAAFPWGYWALLLDRSSVAVQDVFRLAGVIEPTYRDEWKAVLYNGSGKNFSVSQGQKIIQILFMNALLPDHRQVTDLPPSIRGTGGFGSTGDK